MPAVRPTQRGSSTRGRSFRLIAASLQTGSSLRARKLEPVWSDAAMSLKERPRVLDPRCVGLTAGIDLASLPDAVGRRAYAAMVKAFADESLVIRVTGETIALTPPLI